MPAVLNRLKKKNFPYVNIAAIGVFISVTILFLPVYSNTFESDIWLTKILKTIFISIHHAIRLFIVDSDFDIINGISENMSGRLYSVYSGYAAILYVVAPILTFGVVLSFFKSASAYRKLLLNRNRDMYVFSKLNDKSIALAESIINKSDCCAVVFAGVGEQSVCENCIESAKTLNAICLKHEITSINFHFHNNRKKINFFTIDDDESQNVWQGLKLIETYKNVPNVFLYVFSNKPEGEALLSSIEYGKIKVRRVSDVRTLIYTTLKNTGAEIFREAVEYEKDKKLISAVIIGMGRHGIEMTKTLAWFGQMDGYRLEITAFDKKNTIVSEFCSICPELMDENHNNHFDDNGESQYKIEIKENIDIESFAFLKALRNIKHITYIFIDVGDDEKNIHTAIKLRSVCERKGIHPHIQAVVSSSERMNALKGITNYSGQTYDIDFIGDIKTFYSVGTIINSDLEEEALRRHLKWGNEEDFWKYEYNYRSSLASALHKRMKIICKIPGVNKPPDKRSENEKIALRMLEHRRWNAYMRSEGFTYAKTRNNLAKTHPCLVSFFELTVKEQIKDDE